MVLGYNSITKHARVFVLTLFIICDVTV
jgi:hypothetical protein